MADEGSGEGKRQMGVNMAHRCLKRLNERTQTMKTLITAVLIAVTLGMTQAELRHTQRNYILRRQEAAQILPTSLTLPLSWQIGFAGIARGGNDPIPPPSK